MGEIFFYGAVTGLLVGVLYDFLRLVRFVTGSRFFVDFLFWIITSFVVFSYLIIFNSGQIRVQLILLITAFFCVYIFSIGQLTLTLEKSLSKKIKIRLKSFKKVLQLPKRVYYNIKKLRYNLFKGKQEKEEVGENNEQNC